uniref:DNA-directed RNA polymerases I and III subunit RPAC1 n=1 Tax=Tetraselmis chuii TaxID=63592 RepID=A0A7S1T811_9CHLO|mmetsp:Transcript_7938/g.14244  ORF Transcript_7938/g.14244 Transcript_7938/m.14244 type:complete len:361 (+) Transcript_7938:469-1551(+)|eukprot:CAMPEP_0177757470 /NCGR_PEP_ID=MMETSP0491_2-20121128/3657_1 /TAXON_ID=63592 /ORGANISM="Tetraselmis chuii, Strain PLY429" /LENGTH=360 /DNA_ID=CAMNT_0019273117 /DNA_START=467 /DNA_END=1549 /DNA_ORIENTATION=+
MAKSRQDKTGKEDGKSRKLPENLQRQRDSMVCSDRNYHTSTANSASQFMSLGVNNSYSLDDFKDNFRIEVRKLTDEVMEFDMIGCDPSMANALRRILIAEVPTVAAEHVFFMNNTSILQDEVLAHRLGMVPLRIDPNLFEFKSAEEAPSEKNTVVLRLDVQCRREDGRVVNSEVYSSALEWLPAGSEFPEETSCRFACGQGDMSSSIGPVHDDILLAKLSPGQCIKLEAHCVKGVGREHAKWSPVATAWYRLKPEVVLLKPVTGEMADELVAACPGLFVTTGSGEAKSTQVTDPLKHGHLLEKVRTMSVEEKWSPYIQLRKFKHHFMFTIESSGVMHPVTLFEQALDIFHDKCKAVLPMV